jgi:hypothetical protein
MQSRAACLLSALSVAITLSVAAFVELGSSYAAGLACVNLVAFAAWLVFGFRQAATAPSALPAALLTTVAVLLLAFARYNTGWLDVAAVHGDGAAATLARFPRAWFLAWVTAPVSLMLLGAFFLARRSPLGQFLAWWEFVYACLDSGSQLVADWTWGAQRSGNVAWTIGASVLVLAVALWGMARLVRSVAPSRERAAPGLSRGQVNAWTLLICVCVAGYAAVLFVQTGPLPVGVIILSMIAGLVAWRRTTARQPADAAVLVPLYLLMMFLFYVHVGEEAITGFAPAIASISGTPWSERDFFNVIALLGPAMWIYGAFSLWRGKPVGNFILWFMVVGMILGEPTHYLVFPVMAMKQTGAGYAYFPGMYTALFPMVPAVLALMAIVSRHRALARQG